MIMKFFDSLPKWLLLLIGLILVAIMGVIDYLTGDYSVLILYVLPVFLLSWSGGKWIGMVVCIAAGCTRFISNLPLHNFSTLNYWNSMVDMLFFAVISLLVHYLRTALE